MGYLLPTDYATYGLPADTTRRLDHDGFGLDRFILPSNQSQSDAV